jgi:hypothetical protein
MSGPPVVTYVATFDRIGRSRMVAPLTVTVEDDETAGDRLAERVDRYARRHLGSHDVEVWVYEDGGGSIIVGGIRSAGDFTWTRS